MRKPVFALMLAALLALCLCAGALADSIYFVGNSNVRTGPGLNYGSKGTVSQGSSLESAGETAYDSRGVAWYKVYYKGGTGWVSSKYADPVALNPGMYDHPDYGDWDGYDYDAPDGAVIATGDANVRTGPGLNFSSLGVLKKGSIAPMNEGPITYDSRGVAWYNINFNGLDGWVSSKYASLY